MRLPSIDILRLVVVAVIVWRHTWPVAVGEHQTLIATATVPFFFFLTGWLWRPRRRDVAGEIRTRWRALGLPYVSWLLIIYVIAMPIFLVRGNLDLRQALTPFLGGSFTGRPFTTFWFFTALIVVALGMRVLDGATRPVLLTVAFACLTLGSVAGSLISRIPLAVGTGVVCLAFALIARVLRTTWPTSSSARTWTAAAVLTLGIVGSLPLGWLDIKYGYFGTPYLSPMAAIAVTWSAIVLLDAAFGAFPAFSNAVQPALSRVASVSVVVVLIHPFVLFLLAAPAIGAPWWVYPCALLIPFAIALLIRRTPARRLLIGSRE